MLNQVRLTNYRKHTNRTFDFSQGLNAIRASNEQGKSSLLEAVLYGFVGSKALSEPLSDVVTYGQPEASLKVEIDFTVDGVDYTIKRSKSGAELTYGGDGRVTGQTETRAFMEKLLGGNTQVLRSLMFAEQNGVRGVLSDPAEAGKMIETLAELGLIDEIISKIKLKYPTGVTKAQEGTITTLEATLIRPEMPADTALQAAQNGLTRANAHLENLKAKETELTPDFVAANAALARAAEVRNRAAQIENRRAALKSVADPGPAPVSEAEIEAVKQAAADFVNHEARLEAFKTKFPTVKERLPLSVDEIVTSIDNLQAECDLLKTKIATEKGKLAGLKLLDPSNAKCSHCGSVLKDVAEIEKHNVEIKRQQDEVNAEVARLQYEEKSKREWLDSHKLAYSTHQKVLVLADRTYWEVDGRDGIPAVAVWKGEPPVAGQTKPDPAPLLAKRSEWNQKLTRYEMAQEELAALVDVEVPDTTKESEFLNGAWAALVADLNTAKHAVQKAEGDVSVEQRAFDGAMAAYNQQVAQQESIQKQIDTLKAQVVEMLFNNKLIKDLQEARSKIRSELWNTVMSAVSFYFTQIRKVETVIEHTADGFTQNGHPVAGLSGSAKDMLGLSVRAALSKTFLPGAPLLVLDEPFAGCDDDREVSGLGVLAALGFTQTVLVTHSPLADAVSDRIILV